MPQKAPLIFKGKWRTYQQRILDSLDYHLRDKKLHIVAAPGAGKTILGIEVISRIQRPTLILCPTNTIKNQWRERICTSFLDEENYGIVSTSLRKPEYLTVTTYQALLAAFCGRADEEETTNQTLPPAETSACLEDYEDESIRENEKDCIASSARFNKEKADEIIAVLKKAKVSMLCFDEAHHLRKEWWKALTYLNNQLNPEQTLALTATPPYDADYGEWKRYQDLCGEIDEVISIPELVKNGDLCPHQDFICFSTLKQHEKELIDRLNQHVRTFIEMMKNDSELLDGLSKMSFLEAEEQDLEMIFESPEFFVSIASLLNSRGHKIPNSFLELFDAKQSELPKFDLKRASVFIKGFIESQADCFKTLESKRNAYFDTAKRLGLVVNNKVVLNENSKIRRLIAGSLGKLDSIVQIVKLESSQLQDRLRMVILTDYIKIDDTACQSIGVVPIWRKLKDNDIGNVSIGVLCGTLILLPENRIEKLRKLLSDNKIPDDSIKTSRFDDDNNFVRIAPKESIRNHIVALVTEMFCAGDLTVLIGTQALLGEGWDAPAINSLILSSTVSSYMLSNQMRGRAIRIDKNNPDKVSNIWHLASIDYPDYSDLPHSGTLSDNDLDNMKIYSCDIEQLTTRFKGFEAPSYYGKHEISSGIERILDCTSQDLGAIALKAKIASLEGTTRKLAAGREQMRQWWKDSLYHGNGNNNMKLSTGVQLPSFTTRTLLFTGYKHIIITFLTTVLYAFLYLSGKRPGLLISVIASVIVALCLVFFIAKFIKTGTVERVMRQIAMTILEAMSVQGIIRTSVKQVGLHVNDVDGQIFVSCSNLPADENNMFIQALQEFLDPVGNPRYLLLKQGTFMGKIKQTDYFAIPATLSANKKSVDMFKKLWEKHIGKCEIVYTRNLEGRKILLKARKDASSALKRERSKRLSKWQ